MSGIGGVGGMSPVDRVMALRAQILDQNQALQRAQAAPTGGASAANGATAAKPTSFADTLDQALKSVNDGQNQASAEAEVAQRNKARCARSPRSLKMRMRSDIFSLISPLQREGQSRGAQSGRG